MQHERLRARRCTAGPARPRALCLARPARPRRDRRGGPSPLGRTFQGIRNQHQGGADNRRGREPGEGRHGPARDQREPEERRREYAEDIDVLHLASELVVDAVVEPQDLRGEVVRRFALAATKSRDWPAKRNAVTPA